jgi:glyoxylase-like metal-dependent hydrolase (beta-lactamase superfamily II)
MLFRQLFDAESSAYSYLLANGPGGKALLIDPVLPHSAQYLQLLADLRLQLALAIDTHTHADHITALGELRAATGCITLMGEQTHAECISARFADGAAVGFEGLWLRAIYTPGHTSESYSLYLDSPVRMVFTGDVLLIRGTGRTDFQEGDPHASYDSIVNKLFALPDDTLLYPGHDYKGCTASTIDEEKRCNPRLAGKSAGEYVALMRSLKLPSPRLMDVAVPANLRCGRAA